MYGPFVCTVGHTTRTSKAKTIQHALLRARGSYQDIDAHSETLQRQSQSCCGICVPNDVFPCNVNTLQMMAEGILRALT